jgi:hypothetical protein
VGRLELPGQRQQAGQVGLAGGLLDRVGLGVGPVADRGRGPLHLLEGAIAVPGAWPAEAGQDAPGPRPSEEGPVAHLVRNARRGKGLLEGLRAGVHPVQDRHLLERHADRVQPPHLAEDHVHLGGRVGHRTGLRLRARGARGPQGLVEPAEPGRQAVGHGEDLGRRAVVPLQPDDGGAGVSLGERQEVVRRGAGEAVDRLVVVADHAELVAASEPPLEQGLLEGVHVLVLVDREGQEGRPDPLGRRGVLVEQAHRQGQHVLEIEAAHRPLPPLVPGVDPEHQLRGHRRLVTGRRELAEVPLGRNHPVLGPLDLAGEVAPGEEPVGRGQRIGKRRDERGLGVEHVGDRLAGVRRPQPAQLGQGRGVEGPGLDAVDPQ